MSIFESLSFCERRINFRKMDFSYSILICLAVLVIVTFNDFFDAGVVETLIIAGLTILHLSMGYCMQT